MVRVLCPVADGTEDIEFAILTDVLVRGGAEVVVASVMPHRQVRLARGLTLLADALIDDLDIAPFDAVALAGGMPGAEHFHNSAKLNALVVEAKNQGKVYAAVCASPAVVFAANPDIIAGIRSLTGYPASHQRLRDAGLTVPSDVVVVDGRCITSQGPGTSFDFALKLVEVLVSPEKAAEVRKALLL
jgi:4-methyl-5(b-hydroxyethyl)-thiazole monophosphate biosynthesis